LPGIQRGGASPASSLGSLRVFTALAKRRMGQADGKIRSDGRRLSPETGFKFLIAKAFLTISWSRRGDEINPGWDAVQRARHEDC